MKKKLKTEPMVDELDELAPKQSKGKIQASNPGLLTSHPGLYLQDPV